MSKDLKKSEIKRMKGIYCNLAVFVGMGAMIGIVLSPSIPITLAATAVGSGVGLISLNKINKLNAKEKDL